MTLRLLCTPPRRVWVSGWFCCLLALLPGATAVSAVAGPDGALRGMALVEALREGGYTLYFRHTATDWSQQDRVRRAEDWPSCDPQRMRQLSDAGRQTARAVGAAMRALGVPVGAIHASPYCRTMETAAALQLGTVEATTAVVNLRVAGYFGGRAAVIDSARRLLAQRPAAGTNRVIVAHGNVAREATPVYPDEGEAVVFAGDGNSAFRVVGRLKPEDWLRLSAGAVR